MPTEKSHPCAADTSSPSPLCLPLTRLAWAQPTTPEPYDAPQLRFRRLLFPTLQPGVVALLNTYGPALALQTLLEVVVHTLRPQDLALPDALGMQPGSMTVTTEGLTIGFVPKGRPG